MITVNSTVWRGQGRNWYLVPKSCHQLHKKQGRHQLHSSNEKSGWSSSKCSEYVYYTWTWLKGPQFVWYHSYNIIHFMVPTDSPYGMCFSSLLSMTYIRASTLDITTLSIIVSNTIFQEVDYFSSSTISSTLTASPLCFQVAAYIPGLENNNSNVIHFVCKFTLYLSTAGNR
jgi:hypothetical protein